MPAASHSTDPFQFLSSLQSAIGQALGSQFEANAKHQQRKSSSVRLVNGPPFAAISATFLGTLPAKKSAVGKNQVIEPSTNVTYPEEYCLRGHNCTELTGLGVRTKNLVVKTLNVYTVGLYVHHHQAKSVLNKHKGKPLNSFVKSQQPYDDVVRSDNVPKMLRLVITYSGLKKSKFLDALDERLTGPVTKAGDGAALKAFRSQFDTVALRKGSIFTFYAGKGGKLSTFVGNKQIGTITSVPLVHALFDIYTGPNAVSPKTKESFGRGLHAIISH